MVYALMVGVLSGLFAVPAFAQQPGLQAAAGAPAPLPGPTVDEALKALATARSHASGIGVNLSCVVVDSRGDIVAVTRMAGARVVATDVARGKAVTSAVFGQPSGSLGEFGTSPLFATLNASVQGRLYPLKGGLPLRRSNDVIGAIGCSGGTDQQDEDAANAAVKGF